MQDRQPLSMGGGREGSVFPAPHFAGRAGLAMRSLSMSGDNATGLNSQYGSPQFGLDTGPYASTGATGSAGITASETAGGLLASPVVSTPYASAQIPANRPTVAVMAGDTCSSSADAPVPVTGDPMTGLSLAQVTTTGAGLGSPEHIGHPNSMNA